MASKLSKPLTFRTAFHEYSASEILGQGGSGIVYGARDDAGDEVAVKVLDPNRATRDKIKRFHNEYRFCSTCDHPNIVKVIDYGLSEGAKAARPFFVMSRYEGSLRALMAGAKRPVDVLKLYASILDGIEAAHLLDVVHRDIKPENVLYRNGGAELVVTDFGIARFAQEELYTLIETAPTSRLANFMYAAPEQRTPGTKVTGAADVYALGLILNELFTGTVPHGSNFKRIASVAPEYGYLDEIVDEMISQSPVDRTASVSEVKKRLIGRQQEFVALQELDAARKKVVPAGEVVDPLFDDPPRIVNVEWDGSTLTLYFHRPVSAEWIHALNNMGSYSSAYHQPPSAFRFIGNKDRAVVAASGSDVQSVVDHFMAWIPKAHAVFRQNVQREKQRRAEVAREQVRREAAAAEERAQVLRNLRF